MPRRHEDTKYHIVLVNLGVLASWRLNFSCTELQNLQLPARTERYVRGSHTTEAD
jgi:hypothetical protein